MRVLFSSPACSARAPSPHTHQKKKRRQDTPKKHDTFFSSTPLSFYRGGFGGDTRAPTGQSLHNHAGAGGERKRKRAAPGCALPFFSISRHQGRRSARSHARWLLPPGSRWRVNQKKTGWRCLDTETQNRRPDTPCVVRLSPPNQPLRPPTRRPLARCAAAHALRAVVSPCRGARRR